VRERDSEKQGGIKSDNVWGGGLGGGQRERERKRERERERKRERERERRREFTFILRKMTCNSRHPMGLSHPVLIYVDVY